MARVDIECELCGHIEEWNAASENFEDFKERWDKHCKVQADLIKAEDNEQTSSL